MTDIIGMIAIVAPVVLVVLGDIAFSFGNDHRSIVITISGILLEVIAITYIVYKIVKGG